MSNEIHSPFPDTSCCLLIHLLHLCCCRPGSRRSSADGWTGDTKSIRWPKLFRLGTFESETSLVGLKFNTRLRIAQSNIQIGWSTGNVKHPATLPLYQYSLTADVYLDVKSKINNWKRRRYTRIWKITWNWHDLSQGYRFVVFFFVEISANFTCLMRIINLLTVFMNELLVGTYLLSLNICEWRVL